MWSCESILFRLSLNHLFLVLTRSPLVWVTVIGTQSGEVPRVLSLRVVRPFFDHSGIDCNRLAVNLTLLFCELMGVFTALGRNHRTLRRCEILGFAAKIHSETIPTLHNIRKPDI